MTEQEIKDLIAKETATYQEQVNNLKVELENERAEKEKVTQVKENLLKAKKQAESKVKETVVTKDNDIEKLLADLNEIKQKQAIIENKEKISNLFNTLEKENIKLDVVKNMKQEQLINFVDSDVNELKGIFGVKEAPKTEVKAGDSPENKEVTETPAHLKGIIKE